MNVPGEENSGERFFTNRELFERMEQMAGMFTTRVEALNGELTETQRVVKEYNGLRKKLEDVCRVVDSMVSEGVGKNKVVSGVVVIIGVVGTLIGIAGAILALAASRGM